MLHECSLIHVNDRNALRQALAAHGMCLQATPRSDMDEDMASPFTPHLEALAGHLNNFQVPILHVTLHPMHVSAVDVQLAA